MSVRSAREAAAIFCMIRARWTLIVASVIPRSDAVCLFSWPATTWSRTSRSRSVSDSYLLPRDRKLASLDQGLPAQFEPDAHRGLQHAFSHGLLQKIDGSTFIARVASGIPPNPVRNTAGGALPACCSRSYKSIPEVPESRTSSTRHVGREGTANSRNAPPDSKTSTSVPFQSKLALQLPPHGGIVIDDTNERSTASSFVARNSIPHHSSGGASRDSERAKEGRSWRRFGAGETVPRLF